MHSTYLQTNRLGHVYGWLYFSPGMQIALDNETGSPERQKGQMNEQDI
jgi:hypothetical protein